MRLLGICFCRNHNTGDTQTKLLLVRLQGRPVPLDTLFTDGG